MDLTPHHKKSYGAWAGNSVGHKPDPTRCAAEVATRERWSHRHQCNRKRGHGPEGAFCKQHDPEAIAARDAEVWRRGDERWRRRQIEIRAHLFLKVLRQIADGHNDPRTLARETIAVIEEM